MMTICFVYFRSLGLANLAAALYSVLMQDLSHVKQIILVDNNTDDTREEIQAVIDALDSPIRISLASFKHGDPTKTHSWSTNTALRWSSSPWVLFTRADYLLRFDMLKKVTAVIKDRGWDWNGFVTGDGHHLQVDVGVCESTTWRQWGPDVLREFPGATFNYTTIDAGVWAANRLAFNKIGGLDERLTAWGHAQTDFQYRLYKSGVEFVRIPEVLFYHPLHAGARDLALAHQQLRDHDIDIKELWSRFEGVSPY